MFDVIVIGGGVIGGMVLRELTKYKLNVCLLEKENDVCMGASKANSGIVHAGFDAPAGSLKAKFNVLGNKMMADVCRELGVKYRNNGSIVAAFSEEEKEKAKAEMQKMLDYVEKLDELDTSEVEPMSHIFQDENVFREDVVTNGDNKEAMLANAPKAKEGQYQVPKTIG